MCVTRANQLANTITVASSSDLLKVIEGLSNGFFSLIVETNAENEPLSDPSFRGWVNRFSSTQIMIQLEAGVVGNFNIYQNRKSDTWRGWRLIQAISVSSIRANSDVIDLKVEYEILKSELE